MYVHDRYGSCLSSHTWCMYINQQNSWSTLSPLHSGSMESLPLAHNAQHCPSFVVGRAGASPPSLTTCARCLYNNNNNNNNNIYDRHHTVYFSKCFYALLFHRHLSTFHTMRMRGVYVFDCTIAIAPYIRHL